MASRGFAVALLAGGALAHPRKLQCGDERFTVGSTAKCMTLDIEDQQEHPGLRFEADTETFARSGEVHLTLAVESPGPYDNSTGQDSFGIYFAILANATDSTDYGSFTEMPESVAPKDNATCPHMVYSGADDTCKDTVALTWTAGPKTCGDVTFTMLWGNGPGDTPKAPEAPFLHRTVLKVSGEACGAATTTSAPETTAAPSHTKDILLGIFKGLLADTDDFSTCELDGMSASLMFAAALADLQEGKIVDSCTDLSIALGKITPLVADCQVVAAELGKLAASLKGFSPAKAEANFKAHETEIREAVAEASKCMDAEDWAGFGMHLGEALRHVIEEEATPTTSVPATTTVTPTTTTTPATTTVTTTSTSTATPVTSTTTSAPAAATWVCSICSHVYDPEADGAGAAFEDLTDDWRCPVCLHPKSYFRKQEQEAVLL